MKTSSKVLLISSIVVLAISLTPFGANFLWGVLKPAGAILFIAFFIRHVLSKEMAAFDEEERKRLEEAERALGRAPRKRGAGPDEARSEALKPAPARA